MELRNSEGGWTVPGRMANRQAAEEPNALKFQVRKASNISRLELCILYSLREVFLHRFAGNNEESVLQAHQAQ